MVALVRELLDRIEAVYRPDYVLRCAREEPDSLLGICHRLRSAVDEPEAVTDVSGQPMDGP